MVPAKEENEGLNNAFGEENKRGTLELSDRKEKSRAHLGYGYNKEAGICFRRDKKSRDMSSKGN